jgi:hypothetical protein
MGWLDRDEDGFFWDYPIEFKIGAHLLLFLLCIILYGVHRDKDKLIRVGFILFGAIVTMFAVWAFATAYSVWNR